MDIISIFEVTELKTDKQSLKYVPGDGQKAISELRKQYPRWTKFVLQGHEIDGTYFPLDLNRR